MNQQRQVRVGDVVAWDAVPSGALVRDEEGDIAGRVGDIGHWARIAGGWLVDWRDWLWVTDRGHRGFATIMALDLRDAASYDEVRTFAEVFEVREAFQAMRRAVREASGQHINEVAERLHAAGWRPGMTAEDAARLLSAEGA